MTKKYYWLKRATGVLCILVSLLSVLGYSTLGNLRSVMALVVTTPTVVPAGKVISLQGTAPSSTAPTFSYIRHVATGTADILWDQQKQTVNIKLTIGGMAPSSVHPVLLHTGSCATGSKAILYASDKPHHIVADAKGAVTSLILPPIPQIKNGIPASGWYLDIQNGPDLLPETQKASIACGDIVNFNTSTAGIQIVDLTLWSTKDPNQAVSGKVLYSIVNKQLTITITAIGFVPKSTHMVRTYLGTCRALGKVVDTVPLKPIIANASGLGTSTSVIPGIASLPHNWYLAIHLGATLADLNTQTGFDPIACTNVPPSDGVVPHTPA